MSLPATDNFDRANGPLGANWAGSVDSDLAIVSNECAGTFSANNSMYWSADSPDPAQYCQVTLRGNAVGDFRGPLARASATDWVLLDAYVDKFQIEWYNGGAFTQIGSTYSATPIAGDDIKITSSGTTFKGYVNGTERISGTNAGAPSSGSGGIYIYGTTSTGRVDAFVVGNLISSSLNKLALLLGIGN